MSRIDRADTMIVFPVLYFPGSKRHRTTSGYHTMTDHEDIVLLHDAGYINSVNQIFGSVKKGRITKDEETDSAFMSSNTGNESPNGRDLMDFSDERFSRYNRVT